MYFSLKTCALVLVPCCLMISVIRCIYIPSGCLPLWS